MLSKQTSVAIQDAVLIIYTAIRCLAKESNNLQTDWLCADENYVAINSWKLWKACKHCYVYFRDCLEETDIWRRQSITPKLGYQVLKQASSLHSESKSNTKKNQKIWNSSQEHLQRMWHTNTVLKHTDCKPNRPAIHWVKWFVPRRELHVILKARLFQEQEEPRYEPRKAACQHHKLKSVTVSRNQGWMSKQTL